MIMRGEVEILDWRDDEIEWLEKLANLLDSRFTVPGTRVRFGLDSVIGLMPVAGDTISLFVSLYVVRRLSRLGLPRLTVARMYPNTLVDAVGGAVPLAGDLFDVMFRANRRNIALARRALRKPGLTKARIE